MNKIVTKTRVPALDGLRVVAILMVMLYHYYYRFLGTYYLYNIEIPEIFRYGSLGVELFFIISGFVITLSLTKCSSFTEFIKKRFIRLIPAMLICSSITFLFALLFDKSNLFPDSQSIPNLLISYTFISPELLNKLFLLNVAYIDGAYWSLWVEITFYVIAGVLFFLSDKHLLRNFSIFVFMGVAGRFVFISRTGMDIISPIIGNNLYLWFRELFKIFTFFEYGIWFLIGMVLKNLYFNKKNHYLLFYFIILFGIQTLLISNFFTISFSLITFLILILFLYKPMFIAFLGSKTISKIGVASYSIYLIHQNVGVIIINKFSSQFGSLNWMIPILVIVLLSLFGIFSYKFLEVPLGKVIKKILFKSRTKIELSIISSETLKL